MAVSDVGQQERVPAAFFLADVEDVVVELRELPGGVAGLLGQQVRGQQELVPGGVVLAVEEIEQRPFQRGALAGVDPVAVAAELGAAGVVDEPEPGAELHVVEGLVPEVGLAAPGADDLVGLLAAGRGTLVGQVGQLHQQVVQVLLGRRQAGRHLRDLVAERGGLALRLRGIGPRRLQPADLLRLAVPLGPNGVDLGGEPPPEGVGRQDRREVDIVHAPEQGRPHEFGIRPDQLDIQHYP